MDEFSEICRSKGIPIPKLELEIPYLAALVISDENYAIPVFAAFHEYALPIVSDWLTKPDYSSKKHSVFCRLCLMVPLMPQLQLLVEHFIGMHSANGSAFEIWKDCESPALLNECLLAVFRLLTHSYGRYSHYFSADSIRLIANSENIEIRQLSLAILALKMNVSEHKLDQWISEYCGMSDSSDFQFKIVLKESIREKQDRLILEHYTKNIQQLSKSKRNYESHLVTNIGGIYVPRIGGIPMSNNVSSHISSSDGSVFVETESTQRNLFKTAKHLLLDSPMLLRGDSGSGKTCLVEYLHKRVRGGDLLRIHLGDQTDAKALIGTYTTGSKPGTFEWMAGALTSAVQKGLWVLIEDIDRAPNEIAAILISLLESRELVIPSRDQVIKAAPGFQLIATTTSSGSGGPEIIGSRCWAEVDVAMPSNEDLEEIIRAYKPFIKDLESKMLVAVYQRVEEWQEKHTQSRSCSTRDLIKLVKRLSEKYDLNDKFREAVSCFTSFLPHPWPLIEVIADAMHIAPSAVHPLLERYVPQVTMSDTMIVVGRAEVERRAVTGSAARNLDLDLNRSKFSLTQPTRKLLEDISVAVQHLEPVLLVGETGTGKTAMVQYLAKLARRKLVVINVSQQVEAGDLIGGFKPVDARQLAGPLLEDFSELFDATFNRAKNHKFLEVLDSVVSKQQWANVVKVLRQAVKLASETNNERTKRAKISSPSSEWNQFAERITAFEERVKAAQKSAQFQFIEGLLIRAIRNGHWVLLDELNLAPADTIEGIGELISNRMLTMLESGGNVVHAHTSFRLFANMNPATDVGKRDLPRAVRSQFTELWSLSPDSDLEALREIIRKYLPHGTDSVVINDVAQFYITARDLAKTHQLADGAGQRPHFSIRTLSRALVTASAISPTYHLRRALFEAFSMCFLTLLDETSAKMLSEALDQWILSKIPNLKSVMNQIPPEPKTPGVNHIRFKYWWMPCGSGFDRTVSSIQDDSEKEYILTPSVERNMLNLVRASALKMFPILIQGPTSSGKTSMITFLAKRTGHKVVRINNHEHTDLSEYLGGYTSDTDGKLVFKEGALVTALREGHWLVLDELNLAPTDVLEALNRLLDDNRELLVPETQELIKPHPDFILFATQNPPGIYAGRKVLSRAFRNRFLELHFGEIPENELEIIVKERSGIAPSYAAKIVEVYRELGRRKIQRVFEQAATLRDLFRWAQRPAIGYEQLGFNGFALLGERSRSHAEKIAVKEVIENVLKVTIDTDIASLASADIMAASPPQIIWTNAMKRVLALVSMAIEHHEPVLLIGETGCGKTTIVQTIAAACQQRLITLNAHQNTETGDLVGSQRPVRGGRDTKKLFEWVDGPLVTALREGDIFLLDEISLADDSVLERLNSVLEPERTLFVPEIGAISAHDGFQFLATMNPGGDYGKKELSPALRNRFTEIWVPTVDDENDLSLIVSSRLPESELNSRATEVIVQFSKWFGNEFHVVVSLRDILSWVEYINAVGLDDSSVVDGAMMVFVDGLGIQPQFMSSEELTTRARNKCIKRLGLLVNEEAVLNVDRVTIALSSSTGEVMINGYPIPRVQSSQEFKPGEEAAVFSLSAPTSALNAMRVLRAMRVNKPVLLEGSPGAGKTSLITELAKLCGVPLTRINLSDQTDLSDLFGQDVPLSEPGKFGWRSAPFLRAMEKGEWVLLDEMNLAPQPVLEGLNACLDHRGEAYIPELDRVFPKHPNFTVFAAQNPQGQGGGRKGLPKSFVNRFSVVFVEQLGLNDLYAITESTHPQIDSDVRNNLCDFIEALSKWCTSRILRGGPFEFNLRDTLRWLDLIEKTGLPVQYFLNIIVADRLRHTSDKSAVKKLFYEYFDKIPREDFNPIEVTPNSLTIGKSSCPRSDHVFVHSNLGFIPSQTELLETALTCVRQAWPLILVGDSGSGKTSIIRLLAQICGARLVQFSMTADIDSTDLLGEFDQLERDSELQRLWSFIEENTRNILTDVKDSLLVDAIKRRDIHEVKSMLADFRPVQEAIEAFEHTDFSKPLFHWVDGMLVKAVEQGDWLILDNANLCSSAVLDRLNSLLERGGSLAVNECAQEDGSPRLIKPHPQFRLFLTVNPKYGELSRAMRNRGVEVWVPPNSYKESHYSLLSSKKSNIAGALPLIYTKPLSNARLMDMTHNSWMQALIIDHRTPLEYLSTEMPELASFAKSCTAEINDRSDKFTTLYESWIVYRLNIHTSCVLNPEYSGTLFQLSALKRERDSIECDFDVFGIIKSIMPYVMGGGDLGSVAEELVMVKDPSRIHVFREWLLEYCSHSSEYLGLSQAVKSYLGSRYDFSAGGKGMELLWQRFGRKFGFADEQQHHNYLQTLSYSAEFDRMSGFLGIDHFQQISEIRALLAMAASHGSFVDQGLSQAIDQFRLTIENSPKTHSALLEQTFRDIWYNLALVFAVEPNQHLLDTLSLLSTHARLTTGQLESIVRCSNTSELYVPDILVPQVLEKSLINALRVTSEGQAQSEIDEIVKTISHHGNSLCLSTKPDTYVAKLMRQGIMHIENTLPGVKVGSLPELSAAANCVALSQSLLSLYVCPLPLDPAIAQHVWYERYLKLKEDYENDEKCWVELQQVFASDSTDLSQWLGDRYLKQEEVPSIWRPVQSTIAVVHRHMVACAQLASGCGDLDKKYEEEIDLLLKNAQHLFNQLDRATSYRDLTSVVKTALSLLKIGLTLKVREMSIDNVNQSFKYLDPVSISSTSFAVHSDEHLLAIKSLQCLRDVPLDISILLDSVYRIWTLERLRIEEQNREKLAGFKYNDDVSEDERVEREFRQMFPDYDVYSELPDVNQPTIDTSTPEFVQCYCDLFLDGKTDDSIVEHLIYACENLKNLQGNSDSSHLAALFLALRKRSSVGQKNNNDDSHLFNFYTDSSPREAVVSVKFAELVKRTISPLLEKWPEHDNLQSLEKVANDVLDLPPNSPVALHLSKTEQFMHYLSDWDKYATKEFKLSELVDKCADNIVRWRKLELKTWPALFDFEKQKAAKQSAPFWFHLYETLIKAAMEDLTQTAKVIVIFLSESTVGQFEARLRMLEAFEQHLILMRNYNIHRCVTNVRSYFTQFVPLVRMQQETAEKRLRKQVNEVVELASLRDKNPAALKQSAQRSHRALFKHIKKFRDILESKVVSSFEEPPKLSPYSAIPASVSRLPFGISMILSLLQPMMKSSEWNTRPRHLKDIASTSAFMDGYISKVGSSIEHGSFESFAQDIVNRSKKLRDETPNTWTKENKKLISTLKVEKQQLLTLTLRELRKSGLSSAVTRKTLEHQLELIKVLATTPSFTAVSNRLSIADNNFFALIELIPKLRSVVSDAATDQNPIDAPISDIQRGLGFVENTFCQLLKLRNTAYKHTGENPVSLDEIYTILLEFAKHPQCALYDLDQTKSMILNTVHTTKQVLRIVDSVTCDETKRINTSPAYAVTIEAETFSDVALQTEKPLEWLNQLREALITLSQSLTSTDVGSLVNPNISSLLSLIETNMSSMQPLNDSVDFDIAHESVSSVSNAVLVSIQQVMKIIDNYRDQENSVDNENEDEQEIDWFTRLLTVSRRALLILRYGELSKQFVRNTRVVAALSRRDPDVAAGLAASLLPFLRGYISLCDTVEETYAAVMFSAISGTYKLSGLLFTIAKEGFCSPQPLEDDSDDEQDQKGDGVGLGDGAGQSNSSKDVDEEDDDVAEAMQTSNPEQQEKEEGDEGEDHAKEMEGDMAGELEDLPPQDESDEEKSDQEEENDDLDEEMGDIDNMDSNAVDEKMWDDNKQEDLDKEKNSDQNVNGNKEEDVQAAEDDAKQDSNSGEPGEGNDDQDGDEGDADGSEESEAEAQEDTADQGEKDDEQMNNDVEEKDALELPDDMKLEGGEESEDAADSNDGQDENDEMDLDQDEDGEMDQIDGNEDEMNEDKAENELDQAEQQTEGEKPDPVEEEDTDAQAEEDGEDGEAENDENASDDQNPMASEEEKEDIGKNKEEQMDAEADHNQVPDAEGDTGGADVEGVEGLNDEQSHKDESQSTATDNQTESRAQGSSEDASTEQSNMASGGTSGANNEDEENNDKSQDEPNAENEQNEVTESLKQLGDAMKEFHKRQREIREHQDREEETKDTKSTENDTNEPLKGDEELEHVGAEDAFDTQALGKAMNEERQEVDEKMAIDDDEDSNMAEQEVAGEEESGAEHGGAGAADNAGMSSDEESDQEEELQSQATANMNRIDSGDDEDYENNIHNHIDEPSNNRNEGDVSLWQIYESKTQDLALLLGEQLRLILEPTVVSKLRGDYRTGKRLNMKRIIPYIASEFRKDKIWLRRAKPAKREYQVMLALDDSKSMGEPAVVDLAFQAITLVGKALGAIEAGQIGIAKFGSNTEILHPLDKPLTPQAGNEVFSKFGFNQQRTNVHQLLETTLDMFSESSNSSEQWKLEIIVSDGIADDHKGLRKLVRRAYDEKVMLVFVVLDALNKDTSILNMNEVRYSSDANGMPKLEVVRYMEDFAFDYYVIVRDIADLPMVLASVLRQYFQAVDS